MQEDSRVPTPHAIAVDFHPSDAPTFAAAVRLVGEHDLSTEAEVRAALSPIYGDVLVDLSACTFIGSTVLGVMIADSQTREREGHCLELLVPTANRAITRTLEVSGVTRLLFVRTEPGSGAQEAREPA
jgi:anti-anti-sigma factor